MKGGHLEAGRSGEETAARYLKRIGCRILHRNYRTRCGELDLVCMDGDVVVFVEVKSRRSRRCGSPLEAVDGPKQGRLRNAALLYLQENRLQESFCRFDVIGIEPDAENALIHVKNAF